MIERVQNNEFPTGYSGFLQDILTRIRQARYEMLMSVSKQTLLLYWDIGRAVSGKTQSATWGAKVVTQLSRDLQTEIPGVRGFSVRNIWNMKMLYDFYAQFGICATAVAQLDEKQICATAVAQLAIEENQSTETVKDSEAEVAKLQRFIYELVTSVGWTQNCIILEKCKDLKQVVFYLRQTKEKGWSKMDLLEKIEHNYFENHALAQNNFASTVPETLKSQVAWEFLDDYNIELLNPDQPISEKALENAIIENLIKFLHEMGGTFAFVGRQFRLTLDEKEYFVDLLFFNLTLNRYVVFELKAREFSPKDIGQTQMYMQLINKQIKQPFHNSTIGIILCRSKNRLEVEYMLEQSKDPMGVATYNRYSQLPEEYAKYLPSEEEIIKRLSVFRNESEN
ncbi:MAG: PDDEXK nuclease domain-containing protein [Tannerella sp.]|jgi:predicted nuclease of restriction endonuclease-like (RecB) superfamily|nr:PDDEXK nuclease domain-containing protein [Tannerella sp.]